MPESGIEYIKQKELLSYEELLRLVSILAKEGLRKIRITGGEPFLRKDLPYFIKQLSQINGIEKLAITSNATLCLEYIDDLIPCGLTDWNISIDSLDKERFYTITRRDEFDTVWSCIQYMMKHPKVQLKLNTVVMEDHNIQDIIPLVELTKSNHLSVRFIEEMPFNGSGIEQAELEWNHLKILNHIEQTYSDINKLKDPRNSTSFNYQIKDFVGSFGIIPAFTRSFCGSCNRLRLTPVGVIKTCLYDKGTFNIKNMMRSDATDLQILTAIKESIAHKAVDGFEADRIRRSGNMGIDSMAQIGG